LYASELARRGNHFETLFDAHYYLRRLALDAGDLASARTNEASLRYFAKHIDTDFEELREFKRTQADQQ
jgi:hypothetical protein